MLLVSYTGLSSSLPSFVKIWSILDFLFFQFHKFCLPSGLLYFQCFLMYFVDNSHRGYVHWLLERKGETTVASCMCPKGSSPQPVWCMKKLQLTNRVIRPELNVLISVSDSSSAAEFVWFFLVRCSFPLISFLTSPELPPSFLYVEFLHGRNLAYQSPCLSDWFWTLGSYMLPRLVMVLKGSFLCLCIWGSGLFPC